jgi:hypothetical protein
MFENAIGQKLIFTLLSEIAIRQKLIFAPLLKVTNGKTLVLRLKSGQISPVKINQSF